MKKSLNFNRKIYKFALILTVYQINNLNLFNSNLVEFQCKKCLLPYQIWPETIKNLNIKQLQVNHLINFFNTTFNLLLFNEIYWISKEDANSF